MLEVSYGKEENYVVLPDECAAVVLQDLMEEQAETKWCLSCRRLQCHLCPSLDCLPQLLLEWPALLPKVAEEVEHLDKK